LNETEELEEQLAALRKQREAAERLFAKEKKSGSKKGQVRLDCIGPWRGILCPENNFTFRKTKFKWRCNKCLGEWDYRCRRGGRSARKFKDGKWSKKTDARIPKDPEQRELFLDRHTLYWVELFGRSIRIGFDERPLNRCDWDEWGQAVENSKPREIKVQEARLKDLEKQLRVATKDERTEKKLIRDARKFERERAERERARKVQAIMDKYGPKKGK